MSKLRIFQAALFMLSGACLNNFLWVLPQIHMPGHDGDLSGSLALAAVALILAILMEEEK